MSPANAVLTSLTRLRLARLIVDDDYPVAVAAEVFMVSPVTPANESPAIGPKVLPGCRTVRAGRIMSST